MSEIWIIGAERIAQKLNIGVKSVMYLINNKGLPAFRIDDKGPWIARPKALEEWAEKVEDISLKSPPKKSCQ